MTLEEADLVFGPIVFRDSLSVVRVKRKPGGLHAYVHKVKDDQEQLPRGYILGSNALLHS